MNGVIKTVGVFVIAVAVGFGGYYLLDALIPTDAVPTVEEVDTDNLTAGRYHQRTRVNKFFRRGSASSNTDALVAGRYHQRTRVNKFFGRGRA